MPEDADSKQTPKFTFNRYVWILTAGAITRVVELPGGHVFERTKVWLNTHPTMRAPVRNIYSASGVLGFYEGFGWNLAPAMVKTGVRWANVSAADGLVSALVPVEYKRTKAGGIAAVSSLITVGLFCPFERMKVRAMTWDRLTSQEALGLWRGWRPMFVKQATISAVFNLTYTEFLKWAIQYRAPLDLETRHLAVISAASGAVCAAVTTPIGMVKDQMQMRDGIKERRMFRAAMELYRQYGLSTMFRALPVKVLRSVWYFSVTTAVMHKLKALPNFMNPAAQQDSDSTKEQSTRSVTPTKTK